MVTILTCVYCGKEYPGGTPSSDADILTEHIRVCEKHPLRKAEETIKKLRSALEGLIGASEKEELEIIKFATENIQGLSLHDKEMVVNAINVLLEV